MIDPLVIFDIGSTLVVGPRHGPARRIAELTGAAEQTAGAMHRVLMTSDCADADEATDAVLEVSGVEPAKLRSAVHAVWDSQRSEAVPLPGALDALQRLVDRGAQLALLSDIWPPYLESVRVAFGEFFDQHIPRERQLFSFREGTGKPSTAQVDRLVAGAGTTAATSVMVGDSYRKDIEPAAALGLGTVLVRPGGVPADEVPLASKTLDAVADLDLDLIWTILRRQPHQET